jgi:hypothetical protein
VSVAILLGVKQQGREADYLLLSSAEAKNGETMPPFRYTSSRRGAYSIKLRVDLTVIDDDVESIYCRVFQLTAHRRRQ